MRSPGQLANDFSRKADVCREEPLRYPERLLIQTDPADLIGQLAHRLDSAEPDMRVPELTAIELPRYGCESANEVRLRFEAHLGGTRLLKDFPYLVNNR